MTDSSVSNNFPPDSLPSDPLRTARTLFRLARVLDHEVRSTEGADGLTVADLSVLGGIERGTDLPSLLARRLHLDPGRVTRITDRLVTLGYIEREADRTDRRLCRLRLTEAGYKRLGVGRNNLAAAMAELERGLSVEERLGLQRGLEALRRVLDDQKQVEPRSG